MMPLQQHLPFTVLKLRYHKFLIKELVFTLQQHLPFTVLKLEKKYLKKLKQNLLQQHLPFTVLKLFSSVFSSFNRFFCVATALTVYGIETVI